MLKKGCNVPIIYSFIHCMYLNKRNRVFFNGILKVQQTYANEI